MRKFQILGNLFILQKTIQSAKKIGTVSKKFKAPEITKADKDRAALEVMKNTIKGNVMDWWKRLQVSVMIFYSRPKF